MLKIEYMKLEEMKQYENNAKLHPQSQIDRIINSIKEFGFNDPIALDNDNTIIEGHGRFLALTQMGYNQEIPVIKLGHLNDDQKRAYILVHNQLTLITDLNLEALNDELQAITDIDMEQFGFMAEKITNGQRVRLNKLFRTKILNKINLKDYTKIIDAYQLTDITIKNIKHNNIVQFRTNLKIDLEILKNELVDHKMLLIINPPHWKHKNITITDHLELLKFLSEVDNCDFIYMTAPEPNIQNIYKIIEDKFDINFKFDFRTLKADGGIIIHNLKNI